MCCTVPGQAGTGNPENTARQSRNRMGRGKTGSRELRQFSQIACGFRVISVFRGFRFFYCSVGKRDLFKNVSSCACINGQVAFRFHRPGFDTTFRPHDYALFAPRDAGDLDR